jgi:hypothetical protein
MKILLRFFPGLQCIKSFLERVELELTLRHFPCEKKMKKMFLK